MMRCPYCDGHRRVRDGYLRRVVTCPVCGGMEPYCCDGERAQPEPEPAPAPIAERDDG